jgi:hypothetical protein
VGQPRSGSYPPTLCQRLWLFSAKANMTGTEGRFARQIDGARGWEIAPQPWQWSPGKSCHRVVKPHDPSSYVPAHRACSLLCPQQAVQQEGDRYSPAPFHRATIGGVLLLVAQRGPQRSLLEWVAKQHLPRSLVLWHDQTCFRVLRRERQCAREPQRGAPHLVQLPRHPPLNDLGPKLKPTSKRERHLDRMMGMKGRHVGGRARGGQRFHQPEAATLPDQNSATPSDFHWRRLSQARGKTE